MKKTTFLDKKQTTIIELGYLNFNPYSTTKK